MRSTPVDFQIANEFENRKMYSWLYYMCINLTVRHDPTINT